MSIDNLRQLFAQEPDAVAQPVTPLTEREIAFFRASEIEEERLAQLAAARAAAEAEYRASFEGRTEHYREGDPPSAQELGLKVSNFLPDQERLVRYVGWRDQAKAEVLRLIEARSHFYAVMGVLLQSFGVGRE